MEFNSWNPLIGYENKINMNWSGLEKRKNRLGVGSQSSNGLFGHTYYQGNY